MKVVYKLVFNRKKELEKKGKALVQIQAYLNGARRYFSTQFYLTEKEWDKKENNAKDPYTARLIRAEITKLENFEMSRQDINKPFQLSDFDNFLESLKPVKKVEKLSFTEFYRQQLTKQPHLSKATIVTQTVTFKNLCLFKKRVEFEDLTYSFLQEFDIFLRNQVIHVQGNTTKTKHTNTIEKYHRHLRKYINLAIIHDFIANDKNPYRKFKLITVPTDTIFLLPEQRKRMEMLVFTPEQKELEMARDMFLFSCYTGLRHCDSYALTREKIIFTEDGEDLKYQSIKTGKWDYKLLSLLFDGAPGRIIKKYLPKRNNVKIFKGMTSQKVNSLLKIIAVMADVDPKLYFRASRDTFGTTLYMLSGDDKLVQLQLQHSKREQTDKYVHAVQQIQNAALKKIFKQNSSPSNDGGTE